MLVGSLLTKEQLTGWLYTANAATVSKRPAFANLSARRIASPSKPQQFEKLKATVRRVELARKRRFVDLDVYGECRDSEQKGKQKRFVR